MNNLLFLLLIVISTVASIPASGQSTWRSCANWLARASTPAYWNNSGPYVVVVDPMSSGRYLAKRLTERGYRVLGVQSSPDLVAALRSSYDPRTVYAEFFPFEKMSAAGIEEMANRLTLYMAPHVPAEKAIQAVFNGSEDGTVLADGLANLLGLAGNDPALSLTKRDKARMHERLRDCGVAYIPHLRSKHLDKIIEWIHGPENRGQYPVVLKPLDSAATQGVSVCENEEEVRSAFADLTNPESKTVFEKRIDEVLVQSFQKGVEENSEYVVNTVSSDGKHFATDMIRYRKRKVTRANGSHAIIYEFDEFIPLNTEIASTLRTYSFQVLNATGVRFGPAHMEIMMTAKGPVLIEIGARPAGSGLPQIAGRAYSVHPFDLLIDAYLQPKKFNSLWEGEIASPGTVQRMHRAARQVEFIAPRSGYHVGLPLIEKMKKLPSYVSHSMGVNVGEKMPATEDLLTSPGHVELAHEDPQVVEADYATIRAWEEDGFYQISDTPPYDMARVPFIYK